MEMFTTIGIKPGWNALVPVSKKSASVYKSVIILYKSIFRAAKMETRKHIKFAGFFKMIIVVYLYCQRYIVKEIFKNVRRSIECQKYHYFMESG